MERIGNTHHIVIARIQFTNRLGEGKQLTLGSKRILFLHLADFVIIVVLVTSHCHPRRIYFRLHIVQHHEYGRDNGFVAKAANLRHLRPQVDRGEFGSVETPDSPVGGVQKFVHDIKPAVFARFIRKIPVKLNRFQIDSRGPVDNSVRHSRSQGLYALGKLLIHLPVALGVGNQDLLLQIVIHIGGGQADLIEIRLQKRLIIFGQSRIEPGNINLHLVHGPMLIIGQTNVTDRSDFAFPARCPQVFRNGVRLILVHHVRHQARLHLRFANDTVLY